MGPEELLKVGRLEECLAAVEKQVRSNPGDHKLRVFLFQVLAVMGEWDRAQTQLSVASNMNPANALMGQVCRQAILCEYLRAEVWAGKRSPLILGEPEPWVGWMVQALAMDGGGQQAQAAELRAKAFEEAPAVSGTISIGPDEKTAQSHAFEWIADADPRLGPILEALVDGKYYWVPWHRIALLRVEKPADLRDMVWLPVQFVWSAGGQSVGLVPVRYPGSESKKWDAAVRLSRRTQFVEDGAGGEVPVGQRMLATDAGEFSLLDVRSVRLGAGELNPLGPEAPGTIGGGLDSLIPGMGRGGVGGGGGGTNV